MVPIHYRRLGCLRSYRRLVHIQTYGWTIITLPSIQFTFSTHATTAYRVYTIFASNKLCQGYFIFADTKLRICTPVLSFLSCTLNLSLSCLSCIFFLYLLSSVSYLAHTCLGWRTFAITLLAFRCSHFRISLEQSSLHVMWTSAF